MAAALLVLYQSRGPAETWISDIKKQGFGEISERLIWLQRPPNVKAPVITHCLASQNHVSGVHSAEGIAVADPIFSSVEYKYLCV